MVPSSVYVPSTGASSPYTSEESASPSSKAAKLATSSESTGAETVPPILLRAPPRPIALESRLLPAGISCSSTAGTEEGPQAGRVNESAPKAKKTMEVFKFDEGEIWYVNCN